MTGYTRLELGDCAKELHLLHPLAAQAELQAVRIKYSRNFYGTVGKLPAAETTPHMGGKCM